MALPSDKNGEQVTGLRIFRPTKIRFIKCHQLFCEKLEAAIHSYFVEGKLFSKLLKIFKKTQVAGSDFSKFLQSAAIVKINVILGIIFYQSSSKQLEDVPCFNHFKYPQNLRGIPGCLSLLYRFNSRCYLYNLQRCTQNPDEHL